MRNTIMARKQTRAWISKHNKPRLGSLSRRMLFTLYMLAALIFFIAPENWTKEFQFTFRRVFSWPLSIGRNIQLAAPAQPSLKDALNRREIQYQNYIANLEQQLRIKHREVEKLSNLRNRFPLQGAKLMRAQATASIDGLHSMLTISRGKDDGLDKDQFVLADNSIIGTISDVSSRTAWVKLFTDPTSTIGVKIEQLDVDRTMKGNSNNSAKVQLFPIKYKVKVGDRVFARTKPGFLDAPIIIGKVTQCKRDDEEPSLWDITVEPVCDIENLNDVTVIVMNP